jgi:peroxiredoxin
LPRGLRIAGMAAVLGAGIFLALWTARQPPAPIQVGVGAPGFSLPTLGGGEVSLTSLRGKVVLLNFWASWCEPCQVEMPAMERLYRKLRPQGFELIAVSVDDNEKDVKDFSTRLGLTFPILLDPSKRVATTYQTFRYPESFLIDRRGTLVEHYVGSRDWDAPAYVSRIERLMEGGTPLSASR